MCSVLLELEHNCLLGKWIQRMHWWAKSSFGFLYAVAQIQTNLFGQPSNYWCSREVLYFKKIRKNKTNLVLCA